MESETRFPETEGAFPGDREMGTVTADTRGKMRVTQEARIVVVVRVSTTDRPYIPARGKATLHEEWPHGSKATINLRREWTRRAALGRLKARFRMPGRTGGD
jgi:hypothetical protein